MISSSSSDNDGRSFEFEDKAFSKDFKREDNFSEDSGFVRTSLEPQLCVCVCVCVCVFECRNERSDHKESENVIFFSQKSIHRVMMLKRLIDLYTKA